MIVTTALDAQPAVGVQPGAPAVTWCVGCRIDPITGLVAFPDFHAEFPNVLHEAAVQGTSVGIAIGDVDDLKAYVEGDNARDPYSFGHLAGFRVMSQLGEIAQRWFWDQRPAAGCVSTFGGDEIILAAAVARPATFAVMVADLQRRLNTALPCTVSFAAAVVGSAGRDPVLAGTTADEFYLRAMTTLDRHLFDRKATRRRIAGPRSSFVATADLTTGTLTREAS
jgi:GGDEF domain-containing protein